MNKLTKRQKYIKEKYFKILYHNPLHYCPISDERIRLAPITLERIIDMVINILETEECDGVLWEKIT